MLDWLRKKPATPAIKRSAEQAGSSDLLKFLSWIVLGAVTFHSLFLIALSVARYIPLLLGFDLPLFLFYVLILLLHRRGKEVYWSLAATSGLWVLLTLGFAITGGARSGIFTGGYMIVILMSAILLGMPGALFFTFLSTFSSLWLVTSYQGGWGSVVVTTPPLIVWASQTIILLATLGLARLIYSRSLSRYVQAESELEERRQAQQKLAAVERRYRALVENSTDMTALVDGTGHILYVSPVMTRILGYENDEVTGYSSFRFIHPDDLSRLQASLAQLVLTPKEMLRAEVRVKHRNGTWRWVEMSGSNYLFDPDVRGIIVNYRDVTERRRQEEQRMHDVIHDELTGLYNRLLFVDRIENVLRRYARTDESNFAVLMLDIDHFKNINDGLGYSSGDEMLRVVSRRLLACVRSSDTVARLGGDEFGILLDPTDGPQGADILATRIRQSLTSEAITLCDRELIVSCSIGVVLYSGNYQKSAEMLRDAEIAMYRAKATGRNHHIFFNDRMREKVLERVGLEAELRRGLEKGEFVVYYQPVCELKGVQLVGFEALVRWRHPTRGLLLPGSFIEVAEESGIIVALDRWVLEEGCRQMAAWKAKYPQAKDLILNINLSHRDLIQQNLIEQITRVLGLTGLEPGLLRMEISEDLIMESIDKAVDALRQMDRLGVRPEIDDFGSGHSSLEVLATLSFVRTLKIGKNFVLAMNDGADSFEVVRTIIALGHSLNKEVIAEGIETREHLELLRGLGCEYGQGFYFSKGVSAAEAEAMLVNGLAVVPSHSGL